MVKNEEARTVLNGCGLPRFSYVLNCSLSKRSTHLASAAGAAASAAGAAASGAAVDSEASSGTSTVRRTLPGPHVELNAFRQNNVLSEHLGAVG